MPLQDLPESGIYIIEIRLHEPHRLAVGKLGDLAFAPGSYLYVGSALRNLPHRIARHASRAKPLRWHIDTLTTAGRVCRVLVWQPADDLEHQIATALAARLPVFTKFGSSDCRCPGHLFRGDCADALSLLPDRPIADLTFPE